jgi:hypothetical protein
MHFCTWDATGTYHPCDTEHYVDTPSTANQGETTISMLYKPGGTQDCVIYVSTRPMLFPVGKTVELRLESSAKVPRTTCNKARLLIVDQKQTAILDNYNVLIVNKSTRWTPIRDRGKVYLCLVQNVTNCANWTYLDNLIYDIYSDVMSDRTIFNTIYRHARGHVGLKYLYISETPIELDTVGEAKSISVDDDLDTILSIITTELKRIVRKSLTLYKAGTNTVSMFIRSNAFALTANHVNLYDVKKGVPIIPLIMYDDYIFKSTDEISMTAQQFFYKKFGLEELDGTRESYVNLMFRLVHYPA